MISTGWIFYLLAHLCATHLSGADLARGASRWVNLQHGFGGNRYVGILLLCHIFVVRSRGHGREQTWAYDFTIACSA
jgi:hypothetical protein